MRNFIIATGNLFTVHFWQKHGGKIQHSNSFKVVLAAITINSRERVVIQHFKNKYEAISSFFIKLSSNNACSEFCRDLGNAKTRKFTPECNIGVGSTCVIEWIFIRSIGIVCRMGKREFL